MICLAAATGQPRRSRPGVRVRVGGGIFSATVLYVEKWVFRTCGQRTEAVFCAFDLSTVSVDNPLDKPGVFCCRVEKQPHKGDWLFFKQKMQLIDFPVYFADNLWRSVWFTSTQEWGLPPE